jgi:hypothetical protein
VAGTEGFSRVSLGAKEVSGYRTQQSSDFNDENSCLKRGSMCDMSKGRDDNEAIGGYLVYVEEIPKESKIILQNKKDIHRLRLQAIIVYST